MQEAILERANLEKVSLVNSNLESASLQDANLRLALIENSQFGNAKLDGAKFQRASLNSLVFKMASLIAVNFRGANLRDIDFSETILHYAKFDNAEEMVKTGRYDSDRTEIVEKEVFFTRFKNINWEGADVTAITISKVSISNLPKYLRDLYENTFNIFIQNNNTIIRSIEFPKGYEQAGLGILSYFNKIVREKYKDIHIQVSIKQEDHRIKMIIETPEGSKEIIEETLYNYGLVVKGELQPELFLEDKMQVLELKQQLNFMKAQLESSRELSKFKDEHYNNEIAFLRELTMATQKSFPAQITFNPSLKLEANLTQEKKTMAEQRTINTGGGNYNEHIEGNYVQGNYINMSSNLDNATHEICALVDQLIKQGMTNENAQEHIAKDLFSQSEHNQSIKDKLLEWGGDLAKTTVSDVAKNVVKIAIRLTGIPLP